MPRFYKSKTERLRNNNENIQGAINLVLKEGRSIRSAAMDLNISKSLLHRCFQQAKENPEFVYSPNITNNKVNMMNCILC